MGLTVDTSVYVDSIIPKNEKRHKEAKKVLKLALELNTDIFEPRIFIVELAGVLSRFKPRKEIEEVLSIMEYVKVLSEDDIFKLAISIAFDTHCRAVDAYFIATAKLTNSILITNDRIMVNNAKKYNVEAYYLIEDFDRVVERLNV